MEEGNERNGAEERPRKYEFFSKVVRAGRRTYFFDMRVTQGSEFYVTITESKKCIHPDGHPFYEKHKIFLYPEDFEEFSKGLAQITSYAKTNAPKLKVYHKPDQTSPSKELDTSKPYEELEESAETIETYSNVDIDFEDLGSK